jgi:large subunit ribosomal protein L15
MNLAEIKKAVPAGRKARRVGRGNASGWGRTCGKGEKGQKSRAGYSGKAQMAGGQMPLFRRLPKRGFNNRVFRTVFDVVNVGDLERFPAGSVVTAKELAAAGLVQKADARVKVLGNGTLSHGLEVTAAAFSKSAAEKIVAAGGKAVTQS